MSDLGESMETFIRKCIAKHMPSWEQVMAIVREETARRADVMADEVLDAEGAAAYLGICKTKLYEGVGAGMIPGRMVAGKWKFSRSHLYEWLKGDGPRLAGVERDAARRAG